MIHPLPTPHPTLIVRPHVTVIVEPPHAGWLDYMTAFGTVAAAIVAVGVAIATSRVSLRIAKEARTSSADALDKQLKAADDALTRQLQEVEEGRQRDVSAAIARDAAERDGDLLRALSAELGEMKWGTTSPQYHPARAKAIGLYLALGGSERLPELEAAFHGTETNANIDPAIEAVAKEIVALPR